MISRRETEKSLTWCSPDASWIYCFLVSRGFGLRSWSDNLCYLVNLHVRLLRGHPQEGEGTTDRRLAEAVYVCQNSMFAPWLWFC